MSSVCRTLLLVDLERFRTIKAQIAQADNWIESVMKQSALCQRITAIPGVGAMLATTMVTAVGDAKAFKNDRHLAAWVGPVPRPNLSGGKSRLLGSIKLADAYLRSLLIHRSRSVRIRIACQQDPWPALLEPVLHVGRALRQNCGEGRSARISSRLRAGTDCPQASRIHVCRPLNHLDRGLQKASGPYMHGMSA